MKKLFAGIALMGIAVFASAQTISFDKTTWDYGTIDNGADGQRFFTVTNTGDKPLIISKVQPSCGCTTPDWSQEPIMPGKTSKIKVIYDTKRTGAFQKLIEVYSNDPENSRSVVYIKGTVKPAAGAATATAVSAAKTAATSEAITARKEAAMKARAAKSKATSAATMIQK